MAVANLRKVDTSWTFLTTQSNFHPRITGSNKVPSYFIACVCSCVIIKYGLLLLLLLLLGFHSAVGRRFPFCSANSQSPHATDARLIRDDTRGCNSRWRLIAVGKRGHWMSYEQRSRRALCCLTASDISGAVCSDRETSPEVRGQLGAMKKANNLFNLLCHVHSSWRC